MPTYLDYGGISGISGGAGKTGGAGNKKRSDRSGSAGGRRGPAPSPRRSAPRSSNPPPPRSFGPQYPTGSPGGGGGSPGGGGSNNRARPRKPPSIKSYLSGDEVYQQSVRGGKRSLRDFLSELGRRRGEASTTFGQTKSAMESDRVRQLDQLREEFASRGLIHSGLYAQEQGTFQEQFAQQMQALQQQQTALIADLLSQEKGYRREQDLAMELARQEALSRRAERYRLT